MSQQPLEQSWDCNAEGYRVASAGWRRFWDSKERALLANKKGTAGGYDQSGRTVVWPVSVFLQALVDGARVYPNEFVPMVKLAVPMLDNYYSQQYGMYCAAYDFSGNHDIYYDDNAQVATVLITAFEVTGDSSFLDRAISLVSNITKGWYTKEPYGMQWHVDKSGANTCTTAESGICALQLARHITTHDRELSQRLVAFGANCCDWLWDRMFDKDEGLMFDGCTYDERDKKLNIDHAKWTYNQGTPITLCGFLYEATKDERYLQRATELARAATDRNHSIFDRDTGNFEARYYRDTTEFYQLLACGLADYLLFFASKAPQDVVEQVKGELLHTIKYVKRYMSIDEGTYGGSFCIYNYDNRRYEEFKKLTGENKGHDPKDWTPTLMLAGAAARIFFQTARVWPTVPE